MYTLRVLQFLLPFFVAINSDENVQVRGSSYPERSLSNGFLLDYLRSYIGQGLASRYNAPPSFHSGYDIRPNFQNGYDTEPHFQSGYKTGSHFKGGHDTGPHSEFKSNPHLKTDVTRLCDTVTCSNGTCSVIIQDEYSYPVTICSNLTGDLVVPIDVHAACRKRGLASAVLTGDPNAFRPLEPLSCLGCEDCPYGTTCINNACCYGTASCNDTLKRLFEKSFEFNDRVYTLSSSFVKSDQQAIAICVAQGGYLVEIETAEENTAIKNFLRDCEVMTDILISGNDAEVDGVFNHQYSGARLEFFGWDEGQPSGGPSESCIVLSFEDDFFWYDRDCADAGQMYRFLCEFPIVPEIYYKKGYH